MFVLQVTVVIDGGVQKTLPYWSLEKKTPNNNHKLRSKKFIIQQEFSDNYWKTVP